MGDHELANEHPMAAPRSADGRAALGLPVAEPSIEIRVVLFTAIDHRLSLALNTDGGDRRRLLGDPALRGEPLDAGARRIVRERSGLRKHFLEQLYTVSIDQDEQWLVIAAYLGLIWFEDAPEESASTEWFGMRALPPLTGVEQLLVEYGLTRLRAKTGYTTVAFHLLPPAFTLPELQGTYETILSRSLDKRTFGGGWSRQAFWGRPLTCDGTEATDRRSSSAFGRRTTRSDTSRRRGRTTRSDRTISRRRPSW